MNIVQRNLNVYDYSAIDLTQIMKCREENMPFIWKMWWYDTHDTTKKDGRTTPKSVIFTSFKM